MEKLLEQLLESKILTEDTVKSLRESVEGQIAEAVASKEAEVKAELVEQWATEKDLLVKAVDQKLQDILESEMNELKSEIESFRDLEAEMAEKIVKKEKELAETYKADLGVLVEQINKFLESRLAIELKEFADDLAIVKKNEFGMKVFETFGSLFKDKFLSEDEVQNKLAETEAKLQAASAELDRVQKLAEAAERTVKMESLLNTIQEGEQRDVMATLLESVKTADLDTAFGRYVDVIIARSGKKTETKTLEEGVKPTSTQIAEGVAITGDTPAIVTPPANKLDEARKAELRKIAGIE